MDESSSITSFVAFSVSAADCGFASAVGAVVDETLETLLQTASGALQVALDSPLGSLAPLKRPRDAARDVATALLSPDVASGAYYSDGEPTQPCAAVTPDAARELWDWTAATVDDALEAADAEAAAEAAAASE